MSASSNTTTAPPAAPDMTAIPECPSWCRGHDEWWDRDGMPVLDHDGPRFGEHVRVSGEQTVTGAMTLTITVEVDPRDEVLTPAEARQLAADLSEAATWLEAHR